MEQRINALEDEFKVLKSQIKAVLLDIKEYLATGSGNTYTPPAGGASTGGSGPVDTNAAPGPITESNYGGQPAEVAGQNAEPMHTHSHASKTGLLEADRDEDYRKQSETVLCPLKAHSAKTITDESGVTTVDIGGENQVVDLLTVSVLSQWLSRAISIVGKSQITKLVEIYDITGNMPSRLKDTMLLLADLYGGEGQSEDTAADETVPATVSIQLLIELDSLLQYRKNTLESVVFSMLLNKGQDSKRDSHG